MTLFSNHSKLLFIARLFTAVGDLRASMGPPIMVIDSGVVSPRLAMREMAASTGTVGWHTLITWQLPYSACRWRMKSCTSLM
ncbi:Uncharacterised protein [Xylophilus ampelinus]|nr:Uncharacterised protein [Xylophilus ampelinus]